MPEQRRSVTFCYSIYIAYYSCHEGGRGVILSSFANKTRESVSSSWHGHTYVHGTSPVMRVLERTTGWQY